MEIINAELCRVCFSCGCYDLHAHELVIDDTNLTLNSILKEFSALDVDYADNIPSMLCENCTNELGQCYIFLKKLKKADEQLQQLIENSYSEDQEDVANDKTTTIIENIDNENSKENYAGTECDDNIINQCYEYPPSTSEDDENYLIEYLNDENIVESENEEEKAETVIKKGIKRKINNNKTPNIVITDNVCNILSKIQKTSRSDPQGTSIELSTSVNSQNVSNRHHQHHHHHQQQQIEPITDKDSFVITKFVVTGDDTTIDSNTIDNTELSVNQVRTIDMAAVEVNATSEIKESDDEDTNIENPNTMYKCKYCPRAYSTSYYLIKHARKAHCCQFCTKGFEKTDDLFKHVKTEHNQFKCTLCEKDFTSNSNLRNHLKKIHNIALPARISILSFIKKETS